MKKPAGAGLLASLMVVGCGLSTGDIGSKTAGAQVTMTDAPAEDLDSFRITLTRVALVDEDGERHSLFSGSLQVDLAELVMLHELVASAGIPAGSYTGLEIDVASIEASADGTAQTVLLGGGLTLPATLQVVFEEPADVPVGGLITIGLDFDIEDSVADGGGASIVVQPVLFAEVDVDEPDDEDGEEMTGKILSLDAGGFSMLLPIGVVDVAVGPQTLFELADETVIAGPAGLGHLSVGMFVEVEGLIAGVLLRAGSVEVEDGDADEGGGLEVEGVVTALTGDGPGGAPDVATLAVLEVENDPAGDLAGATTVDVDLESGSPSWRAQIGMNATLSDLELGSKVEAQGSMVAGVLAASRVDLKKTRFNGTVAAVSGGSITLGSLLAEGRAIPSLSSRTFAINGGTELSIDDDLPIGTSDLAVGQVVRLKTARDVDLDGWVALKIERKAGDFDGAASGLSSILATSFTMTGDASDLGLGNPATLLVEVQAETEIVLVRGALESQIDPSDLASVLAGLSASAEVKVEGVLSGPSTLAASEIVLVEP